MRILQVLVELDVGLFLRFDSNNLFTIAASTLYAAPITCAQFVYS